MCGIFGYIGPKNAAEIILEGLKRLEYRGYDSWGIAVASGQISLAKKVGAIGDLDPSSAFHLPPSTHGIGHTRWATHGGVTELNAHPHYSTDKYFALAQNGIVENYVALKKMLKGKGYKFETQTDTEVIVRLIEEKLALHLRGVSVNLLEAVRLAFLDLKGRNTIIVLTKDGEIIAARNGSPLVIGKGEKEVFISSDTLSFAPHAKKMIVVENGQLIHCKDSEIKLFDIKTGKKIKYALEKVDIENNLIDKEGYPHFMLKEIHENPYVVNQVLNSNGEVYLEFTKALKASKNVYTIGSGTAGGAASQIAFYLRNFAKTNAINLVGADTSEYLDLFTKDDLLIVPSQSGETADVLEVLEEAKKRGVQIASYVNMPGSTMTRMSDFRFMSNAGPEICVMSTKVYTSQLAWGYLVSKLLSGKGNEGKVNLKKLADSMEEYLNHEATHKKIKELAKILSKKRDIFLLGKYQNLNIMREGMIKIIEGSYIHAHGMPSGDLKHYAITLMEKGVPVIVAVSEDPAKADTINSVNEVRARGAWVVGISPKAHESFDFHIPVPEVGETQAIMNVIPLQLLAYYMAVELGHNVDKPRNIAKSVTVK